MSATQTQLTITVPQQFEEILKIKANSLGISLSQLVKKILAKEVNDKTDATFIASDSTIRKTKKALKERDKAIRVTNIHDFFKTL
jgi:hypothetical protein